jgi:hypothetical protein
MSSDATAAEEEALNGSVMTSSADAELDEVALVEQQFKLAIKEVYKLAVSYYRGLDSIFLVRGIISCGFHVS